jgi:hypothetical protein
MVKYENRRGQTYYLHQGETKTGKAKYYLSMKRAGQLVDAMPAGYEIYENPNAQVFLRKVQPKLITAEELATVEKGIKKYSHIKDYLIEIKKKAIIIHEADQKIEELADGLRGLIDLRGSPWPELREKFKFLISYSPTLQFVLTNAEHRRFVAQRYCYRGSIDDWIFIGTENSLAMLVQKYVKHLGQESYYDLM